MWEIPHCDKGTISLKTNERVHKKYLAEYVRAGHLVHVASVKWLAVVLCDRNSYKLRMELDLDLTCFLIPITIKCKSRDKHAGNGPLPCTLRLGLGK